MLFRSIIDQTHRNMEVIVPDDQLSLAIGKRGQNVRLASKLTNWHIDVKSESRYERQKQAGYQALLQLSEVTAEMADRLYDAGITSLTELVSADLAELQELTRLSESTVEGMQDQARRMLDAATQASDADSSTVLPDEGESEPTAAAGEMEAEEGDDASPGGA